MRLGTIGLSLTLAASLAPSLTAWGLDSTVAPRTIALTGQLAPGAGTERFRSFDRAPVLGADGTVVFSGSTTAYHDGLWTSTGSALTATLLAGATLPGGTLSYLDPPVINASNTIAFTASVTSGTTMSGLWTTGPSGPASIAYWGMPAPGLPAGTSLYGSVTSFNLNDAGYVAFRTTATASNPYHYYQGIWAQGFGPGLTKVMAYDDAAPGTSGTFNLIQNYPTAFANNILAFTGSTTATGIGQRGLWKYTPQGLAAVALSGAPAPGPGNMTFTYFGDPVVSNSGELAFHATNSTHEAIYKTVNGVLTPVAITGQPAPGGRNFYMLDDPVINSHGRVAFTGFDLSPSTWGLWSEGSTGVLTRLATAGTPAPGIDGAVFAASYSNPVVFNDNGQVAFIGAYQIGSTVRDALWAQDGAGNWDLIAREGGLVQVAPGDWRTIQTITFAADGGMINRFASEHAFDEAGNLTYMLTFTDSSTGIFVSTIPLPPAALAGLALLTTLGLTHRLRHHPPHRSRR